MADRLLTVDLGNTRCKLVVWDAPQARPDRAPERLARVALAGDELPLRLGEWLARQADLGSVAISSVASERLEADVRELFEARGLVILPAVEPLENRTEQPHSVGRDRLFAARGALELTGGSAIVVDAGTAVTVDAVLATELVTGTGGAFLGGAIAPGAALGAAALARGAARLPEVEPRAGVRALGRTTEEAILSGVVVGLRGAAAALVEAVAEEAGLGGAPVALTGGASRLLLEPDPFTGRELIFEEDLVHLGLLATAREQP